MVPSLAGRLRTEKTPRVNCERKKSNGNSSLPVADAFCKNNSILLVLIIIKYNSRFVNTFVLQVAVQHVYLKSQSVSTLIWDISLSSVLTNTCCFAFGETIAYLAPRKGRGSAYMSSTIVTSSTLSSS